MKKIFQRFFLLLLCSLLIGCFSWIRAYQTYLQMDEFDKNFLISADDQFSIHFKKPLLTSEDFVALSKLQASEEILNESGKNWRYRFRKIDAESNIIEPEITFYFDLKFNKNDHLVQWTFSPLFLAMAPAKFLEVSIRSIAGAKIDKAKKQLRADLDLIEKISAELPQKAQILSQLGEPLKIKDKKTKEKYRYHFQLDSKKIEKGYEDRGLSVIKLSFDKANKQLIKMSGRFAGLKISIDYRKYQESDSQQFVHL
jgi:hypothetical protein